MKGAKLRAPGVTAGGTKARGQSGHSGLRIIAGQWRGRKLTAPVGEATRPTADRVRETAFSMLTSRLGGFSGLSVADLCAGSGAMGLEALSRGAASCLFVDRERTAADAIRANIAALHAAGAEVRQLSLDKAPPASQPYDLIFLDPPYASPWLGALIDDLVLRGWCHDTTMLCVETAQGEALAPVRLTQVADRSVGKALLRFYRMTS